MIQSTDFHSQQNLRCIHALYSAFLPCSTPKVWQIGCEKSCSNPDTAYLFAFFVYHLTVVNCLFFIFLNAALLYLLICGMWCSACMLALVLSPSYKVLLNPSDGTFPNVW
jgi:hypothetical protein